MQSACQISAYAHYARTPVLQLKQRTDDFLGHKKCKAKHDCLLATFPCICAQDWLVERHALKNEVTALRRQLVQQQELSQVVEPILLAPPCEEEVEEGEVGEGEQEEWGAQHDATTAHQELENAYHKVYVCSMHV